MRLRCSMKLRIDSLETRDVPAAVPVATATFNSGILTVNATNNVDTIVLSQTATTINVAANSTFRSFSAFAVRQVLVFTYNGADQINLDALACPARVLAGQGRDVIIGGRGFDQIYGEADDDQIDGGLGNDLIVGGLGNDTLNGGFGNDEIFGDNANFAAFGGNDTIIGGRGNDWLYGEGGFDNLYAGTGGPVLLGEFDFGFGGAGNDNFYNMPRFGVAGFFVSPLLGRTAGRTGAQDALTYEAVIN